MSDAIESMEVLHFSPILLSPLFVEFYKNLGLKPNGILLAHLVLPLVLHSESGKALKNANSRSSFRSIFSHRERIVGLPGRIEQYRGVSGKAIQYGIDCGAIEIMQELSVRTIKSSGFKLAARADLVRATARLGILFSQYEVVAVFRMLGIKKL